MLNAASIPLVCGGPLFLCSRPFRGRLSTSRVEPALNKDWLAQGAGAAFDLLKVTAELQRAGAASAAVCCCRRQRWRVRWPARPQAAVTMFTTTLRAAFSSPMLPVCQRGCGCEKERQGRLNLIESLRGLGGGCGFMMAALQEYGSARPRSMGSTRLLRMAGEFVTAGDGTLRGTWRGSARGERGRARGSLAEPRNFARRFA